MTNSTCLYCDNLAAHGDIRALREGYRAELSAAIGYMMNAAIDLETGATKATALRTLNGGIKRFREYLETHP